MKKSLNLLVLQLAMINLLSAHPGIGIVKNSKGEVFYSDLANIWKISPDDKTKKIVVPNVHTHELYMDSGDNLYGEHLWYEGETSNRWGHFVWKLDSKGNFTKVINNTEGFLSNYSFNRDLVGNMFWIERGKTESILMKKSNSGVISMVSSFKTFDVRWQFCRKNGDFYYIDDNDLYKIKNTKSLLIASDLDGIGGYDPKRKPNNSIYGIWDDSIGNIYVALYEKCEVRKVSKNGKIEIIFRSAPNWYPTGGIIDAKGNLWVLENNAKNQVRVSFVRSR